MTTNPIDEIKRIRHELGAAVNYDVSRIFADLRNQQAHSGRMYINASESSIADNESLDRSRRSGGNEVVR